MPDPNAVVASYAATIATLRTRVTAYVHGAWSSLSDYRDDDISRFVTLAAPMVIAGQQQVASITDAYLTTLATAVTGVTARPVGVPTSEVTDLRGVPTDEVYRRAGVTTWLALSEGDNLNTAADKGLHRALSLAATDLQMAKTAASRYVVNRQPGVVGFRRALTGRKSCGLCVVASTQRYHKADLLPIHPGCDCAVRPIYGTRDAGHVIDPETLAQAHASITERFGTSNAAGRGPVDYRQALIVHEHGEIGPVLAVRGHAFTGPNDL